MSKIVFPSFSGQVFSSAEMRQLVSAIDLRFQQLESATQESVIPSTDVETEYASIDHTHVEANITDLGNYLTDITAESIFDLSDVVGTPSGGQALVWTGSAFQPQSVVGVSELDDLTDVTVTAPSDEDILRYNTVSGQWENVASSDVEVLDDLNDVTMVGQNQYDFLTNVNGQYWGPTYGELIWNRDLDFLQLANAHSINWLNNTPASVELINFSGSGTGVPIGHAQVVTYDDGLTSYTVGTGGSYENVTSAVLSGLDAGEDYLIYVSAIQAMASATAGQGVRLTNNGVAIAESEQLIEGSNGVQHVRGMPYKYCRIITVNGNIQLQAKGTVAQYIQGVQMTAIKVADLQAANMPDAFESSGQSLTTSYAATSATVSVGNGSDDYFFLVFARFSNGTGAADDMHLACRVGGTDYELQRTEMQDTTDVRCIAGMFYEPALAASTTVSPAVKYTGSGGPTTTHSGIVAIRLNAFADYHAVRNLTVEAPPTGIRYDTLTGQFTAAYTGNYGFLGFHTSDSQASGFSGAMQIDVDINSGGRSIQAGGTAILHETESLGTDFWGLEAQPRADVAITSSDTVDYYMSYDPAPSNSTNDQINRCMVAFSWFSSSGLDGFTLGDPAYANLIDGTDTVIDSTLDVTGFADFRGGVQMYEYTADTTTPILTLSTAAPNTERRLINFWENNVDGFYLQATWVPNTPDNLLTFGSDKPSGSSAIFQMGERGEFLFDSGNIEYDAGTGQGGKGLLTMEGVGTLEIGDGNSGTVSRLDLLPTTGGDGVVGFFEDEFNFGKTYGFSLTYDGFDNQFYFRSHENSAAGTILIAVPRDGSSVDCRTVFNVTDAAGTTVYSEHTVGSTWNVQTGTSPITIDGDIGDTTTPLIDIVNTGTNVDRRLIRFREEANEGFYIDGDFSLSNPNNALVIGTDIVGAVGEMLWMKQDGDWRFGTDRVVYDYSARILDMPSTDIDLSNAGFGDRINFYGGLGGALSASIGNESTIDIFLKAAQVHRWYVGTNADLGASNYMYLNTSELGLERDIDLFQADAATATHSWRSAWNSPDYDWTFTGTTDLNISGLTGGVVIDSNLTVSGTTTTINSNTVAIADNIILLNSDEAGAPTQDAGLEVERGTSANVFFQYDETADRWEFTNDGSTYYFLMTMADGTATNNTLRWDGSDWVETTLLQIDDPGGNHVITSTLDEATGDEIALDLSYTVNKATSGADTGLRLNVTETSSPGTSLFAEYVAGGVTKFSWSTNPSFTMYDNDGTDSVAMGLSGGLTPNRVFSIDTTNTDYVDITGIVSPGGLRLRDGARFEIYDATDTNYLVVNHDGTDVNWTGVNTTDFIVDGLTWFKLLGGGGLAIYDSTNADEANFSHDGTNFNTSFVQTTTWDIDGVNVLVDTAASGWFNVSEAGLTKFQVNHADNRVEVHDGYTLRIYDAADTDFADFSHDGTDFNTAFTTTTDWNITGITAIQAGTVDADFDAITATSYGGILEANLVDKTAAETISGGWNFDRNVAGLHRIRIENTSGTGSYQTDLHVESEVGTAALYMGVNYLNAADNAFIDNRSGGTLWIRQNGGIFAGFTAAGEFQITDSSTADYALFSHDGTDFNTSFTNTIDWNITGITSIQAGTVDADFDAITATSYGGILEANLLDKTANETITGEYTFSDATTARIWFNQTGATVDEGKWALFANSDQLFLRLYNDALTLADDAIIIDRTAEQVNSIRFGNELIIQPPAASNAVLRFDNPDAGTIEAALIQDDAGNFVIRPDDSITTEDFYWDETNSVWKFETGLEVYGSDGLRIENNFPLIDFYEADAALNEKRWYFAANGNGAFNWLTVEDGGTLGTTFLTVNRTTTAVDDITLNTDLEFTLTTQTIAGIQNQNLVDKTVLETVSGQWDFFSGLTTGQIRVGRNTNEHLTFQVQDNNAVITYTQDEVATEAHSLYFNISSGASGNHLYQWQINATAEMTLDATSLTAGNYVFDTDQVLGAGQDGYVLTYTNGTGEISFTAAGTGTVTSATGADNRVAVFTSATNIEGDASFTWDSSTASLTLFDTGDTDSAAFRHDGTNFLTTFTTTDNWRIENAFVDIRDTDSRLYLTDTDAGAGLTSWLINSVSGTLRMYAANDAHTAHNEFMRVDHDASNNITLFALRPESAGVRIYDAGDTDYAQFQHDGTDFNTSFVTTTAWAIDGLTNIQFENQIRTYWYSTGNTESTAARQDVNSFDWDYNNHTLVNHLSPSPVTHDFRDGATIRIRDAGDTDYADFSHDGNNFNTTFVNTQDWKIATRTRTLKHGYTGGAPAVDEAHEFIWYWPDNVTDTTTWMKVCDVVVTSGAYGALAQEIIVTATNSNYGSSTNFEESHYFATYHRSAAVGDDQDTAIIVGMQALSTEIRIQKTSVGNYELQVKALSSYDGHMVRVITHGSNKGTVTVAESVAAGSTTGTTFLPTFPDTTATTPVHRFSRADAHEVRISGNETDYVSNYHDGTDLVTVGTNTVDWNISGLTTIRPSADLSMAGGYDIYTDNGFIRVRGATAATNYAQMAHDDTDYNLTFSGTTDYNLGSGLTGGVVIPSGVDLTVGGDLTVSGTTTTINSNTVSIADNIIVLNSDEAGAPTANAGIEVERGTSANVQFYWNETDDRWQINAGGLYLNNTNLTAVNHIVFNDSGPGEGLQWENWQIYDSPNDLATNSAGNLQFVNAGVREATLETDGRFFARGGFSVPYTIGTKVPVITLEAAENYGLFHTEGTPDIFSFDHGGTARQSFDGNGDVIFTGSLDTRGLTFGSVLASSATDLSDHIALWSTTYGFNITSGNLNVVSSGTNTMSFTSATLESKVNHNFASGIDVTGNITTTADIQLTGEIQETNHGHTGNQSLEPQWTLASDWYNLDVGYHAFVRNTTGTAGGAPVNNYGFFHMVAHRDTSNGWGGLWVGYTAGENYMGRSSAGGFATWDKLACANLTETVSGSWTFSGATTTLTGTTVNVDTGTAFNFNQTTGTSPFTVDSTTVVTNLNADTVDGLQATSFLRSDAVDTFTGNLTSSGADIFMADNTIDQPVIQDYAIESEAPTVSANAVTLTYANGPAFEVDLEPATGTVTITLSGGPPTGTYGEIIVKVQQDTTASRTITWAGGVFEWPGGTAPTMTATADAFDIYHFSTWDGGTTWWGSALQDMK